MTQARRRVSATKALLGALCLALASCTVGDPPTEGGGGQSNGGAGSFGGGVSAGGAAGGVAIGGAANSGGAAGAAAAGTAGVFYGGASNAGSAGFESSGGLGLGGNVGMGGGGGAMNGAVSNLPTPPGAANLPKPSGTAGGLKVLDWAGFKAAVSYTFDDTNSSQIAHYKELAALGVHFTFYLITGKPEASDPVWAQAVADGHEIGNHTKSHSSNATGADIDAATTFLEDKLKIKVWTMAAPNGAAGYTDLAKPRFLINRGVANGLIAPNDNSDPFTLYCYIPPAGASQAMLDAQVTEAQSAGKWRVVLVHGFTGGSDGAYQAIAFDQFSASVSASKALGNVWIDSVVNVGAYWRGQKAFSQAQPTTGANGQTWSWTLPDHFPPGKYLRINVSGGTPTQKGAALPWNPHGYYEVALDAGSLTLAP